MSVALSRRRFTVDDYQRMGEAGILRSGDRVELIDGEIVTKMTIGPRHSASLDRAARAFDHEGGRVCDRSRTGAGPIGFVQSTGTGSCVASTTRGFLRLESSWPVDILLIVEVAESSIDYDRETKASRYARSNVPSTGWSISTTMFCIATGHPSVMPTGRCGSTGAISRWRRSCFRTV
jgi:hypothetical protein